MSRILPLCISFIALVFGSNCGISPTCEELECPQGNSNPCNEANLLNKLTVSQLAELGKLSKAYISQVKHNKSPPSEKLLQALRQTFTKKKSNGSTAKHVIETFLKSRRDGISEGTIDFYKKRLSRAIPIIGLSPTPRQITQFFNSLTCSLGGKHSYYRAISVFYNWLYSNRSGFKFKIEENPIKLIDPPKKPKLILPSLSREQVDLLISKGKTIRDKAIISLFAESGLRLSELVNIRLRDIDWDSNTIKVLGKGNKEGLAPFGKASEKYLRQWLDTYSPEHHERIWNIGFWGVKTILEDLKTKTGLPCNPHTFRRTFACLLRKQGLDCLTIKDLGRWESLEMVQRYTRSVTFQDSLKFYKGVLS